MTDEEATRKTYIPAAFGREPTTPQEALLAAADLLEEEGRWVKRDWYKHNDSSMKEWKDDPFCNGWGACADGALQIVTIGITKADAPYAPRGYDWICNDIPMTPMGAIYRDARALADTAARRALAAADDAEGVYGCPCGDEDPFYLWNVMDFNDRIATTREEVVAVLREAAREPSGEDA